MTDIVVLVVAADDGVQGQTVEAVNHAREAEVRFSLRSTRSINRSRSRQGKTGADGVQPGFRRLGGETIILRSVGKKKTGIEELLEMILLQADMM